MTYDDVVKRSRQTGAELRELYHQRRTAVAALVATGQPPFTDRDSSTGGAIAPPWH